MPKVWKLLNRGSDTEARAMPTHLEQPQRILIFRPCHLGDMLCTVPALKALRALHPKARISLLGLPWAQEFAERYAHLIDDFIDFPGWPGMACRTPVEIQRIPAFLSAMRERRFDLAIQMSDSGELSNPMMALFGAREMAGFYVEGHWKPAGQYIPMPSQQPESWKLLRLMEALGAQASDDSLEFPLTYDDDFALRDLLDRNPIEPSRIVCLHPGGRQESRRWPIERFTRLAAELWARGYQVAVTGSAREKGLSEVIQRDSGAEITDLVGTTDLGTLAALLKASRLLICNDTGVSTLAAAVGAPSLVIYPPEDHGQVHPADPQIHHRLSRIGGVTTDDVLECLDRVLGPANSEESAPTRHLRVA